MALDPAAQRILVALDVPTLPAALALVDQLRDHVGGFKVGLELCTSAGVSTVVKAISAAGGRVFLDLKFKDIPNTVAGAVRALIAEPAGLSHSIHMLNLHCDGGSAMLRAAAAVVRESTVSPRPLLLGVTVLTSIDASTLHQELSVPLTVEAYVVQLAQLAQAAGLDGVVASPHEVAAIKQACGPDFVIVTPGVRPEWAAVGDQQRVMTPAEAIRAGTDYLVIGRPITAAAPDQGGPAAAAMRILDEIAGIR